MLVVTDIDGWIVVDGQRLTQKEAIDSALSLAQAVQNSINRGQENNPHFYDTAAILSRINSPLGKAISALRKVF